MLDVDISALYGRIDSSVVTSLQNDYSLCSPSLIKLALLVDSLKILGLILI